MNCHMWINNGPWPRLLISLAALALAATFSANSGCGDDDGSYQLPGEGEPCFTLYGCQPGLVCSSDGICTRSGEPGTFGPYHGCGSTHDCQWGLICTSRGMCDQPGDGLEGAPCVGAEECISALVCAGDGTCRNPGEAGTGDVDDECESTADCMMGLGCFPDPLSGVGVCRAVEWWDGADCTASDADTDDPRVFFEVPRLGQPLDEFYRLPFPNDIRVSGGQLDLGGHPAPATILGSDLIDRYLRAIESSFNGFSPNGTSFFRFSAPLNFESVSLSGPQASFYIVDITPSSPGYGAGAAVSAFMTTGRGKYICQNWISLRPQVGHPLRHATTYAIIMTADVTAVDQDGNPQAMRRDDDFDALMQAYAASTEPADPDLAAAYHAFQPLWDALDATTNQPIPTAPERILAASVFTTSDPDAVMDRIRQAVRTDPQVPAPTPGNLQLAATQTLFFEIQGQMPNPVYQQGTRPYETPDDGGAFVYDASGLPILQDTENVDFALTVPAQTTMPASGWPVVIFAHGTGGSMHSFINNGVAEALSEVTGDGTDVTHLAVLSYEGVSHGDRRGASSTEPQFLFFNVFNPEAARDNTLQGAADLFQVIRMVETFDQNIAGVGDVRFDPNRIYFYGHSQGTNTGGPAAAYEPLIKAVVLSGAGGHLMSSLLYKTQPLDIAWIVKFVLADVSMGLDHPLLNLFQLYFDRSDLVNYGAALGRWPQGSIPGKDIFQTYGVGDTYSPEQTMMAVARTLGVQLVQPELVDISGVPDYTGNWPVSGNITIGGQPHTLVIAQYNTDGTYDGHYVAQQNPDALRQVSGFFATAAIDGIASLVVP